jgi:prolyl oligopeptidase
MLSSRAPFVPAVLCLAALLAPLPAAAGSASPEKYPETRRVEQTDTYHGVTVADPYRWLETDVRQSDEVRKWVDAENEVTFRYLKAIPEREPIRRRLTEIWSFEERSVLSREGGRYYSTRNDGLQNQDVLYVQGSLQEEPRVLLDPNTWSSDGTVSLTDLAASPDGRWASYGVREAGSDWRVYHVMDLATRALLPDELRWIKGCCAAWMPDGAGFFYTRYPEPQKGTEYQGRDRDSQVRFHRVGTAQEADVLVYADPEHPDRDFTAEVTEDGRWLVLSVSDETGKLSHVLVRDLSEPYGMVRTLFAGFPNQYFNLAGSDGPVLYLHTDLGAPKGRLIAVDVLQQASKPAPESWREIVPEGESTLAEVHRVGDLFLASYLKDANTQVRTFSLDGKLVREVELPGIGTASGFEGRREDTETFYRFASYNVPPSIYRYDLASGESTLLHRPKVKFDPAAYEVEQVFYTSKDGTRVPMFLAHKKGLRRDGSNPTLLYGYGGFNVPVVPGFSPSRLAWMEMGGIFAVANLRGGSEYGEAWHEAGTKTRKQNVFDDFIAAAEWLVAERYTQPAKLAIQGGSNGGLLVGAAMTQRPELFGAALPAVGVMDMLRFQLFTAGRFWIDDYGSIDNPEQFRALYAYSPYHNLKDGTRYPATLVSTADTDDRVVPGHSFKFAARLQRAQAGSAPVLLRVETRAGHGSATPTAKQIEKAIDDLAFLVRNLKMSPPRPSPAHTAARPPRAGEGAPSHP